MKDFKTLTIYKLFENGFPSNQNDAKDEIVKIINEITEKYPNKSIITNITLATLLMSYDMIYPKKSNLDRIYKIGTVNNVDLYINTEMSGNNNQFRIIQFIN